MKTLHDLMGMPLVTLQEGLCLGTLKGLEYNATDGRIRYLHFAGAEHRSGGVLAWDSVRAIGTDAITVEAFAAVRRTVPSAEREEVTTDVRDRPVITEGGTRLGRVSDFEVDETTGCVERYRVATGGLLGKLIHSGISFSRDAVRVFGKDAIIVSDEVGRAPRVEGPEGEANEGASSGRGRRGRRKSAETR